MKTVVHSICMLSSHSVVQKYRSVVSHGKPAFSGTFCGGCGAEGSDEKEIICII